MHDSMHDTGKVETHRHDVEVADEDAALRDRPGA